MNLLGGGATLAKAAASCRVMHYAGKAATSCKVMQCAGLRRAKSRVAPCGGEPPGTPNAADPAPTAGAR
jgi:hypothetical protein